jgi:hypothetical protein
MCIVLDAHFYGMAIAVYRIMGDALKLSQLPSSSFSRNIAMMCGYAAGSVPPRGGARAGRLSQGAERA